MADTLYHYTFITPPSLTNANLIILSNIIFVWSYLAVSCNILHFLLTEYFIFSPKHTSRCVTASKSTKIHYEIKSKVSNNQHKLTLSSSCCRTMFSGLRSLWVIFMECKYCTALFTSDISDRTSASHRPQQFSVLFKT
jgi:hypothetical protein